jgi:hypothetical protein
MRTVVIALFQISLIVGVWLTAQRSKDAEPTLDVTSSEIAPVQAPSERGSLIVAGDVRTIEVPDEQAERGDRRSEVTGPATRIPYHEPQFRDALVGYLVESGLSSVDGERIVYAAIDGFVKCMAASGFDAEGRTAQRVCDQNVLQQAGLNEAIRRTALNDAARNLARRLALERSPGP